MGTLTPVADKSQRFISKELVEAMRAVNPTEQTIGRHILGYAELLYTEGQ
jgi:hypothetical protein